MDYTTQLNTEVVEDRYDPLFYAHIHPGDEVKTVATIELEDGAEFHTIIDGRAELRVRNPDSWDEDTLDHDQLDADTLEFYNIDNDNAVEQLENSGKLYWQKSNKFECGVQEPDADHVNWNSAPIYDIREALGAMIDRANSYIQNKYGDNHTIALTVDDLINGDTDEDEDRIETDERHPKQVFEVNAEDGQVKCGSCNYMTTDLYIIADSESTLKRMDATGRCGTCTMENLLAQGAEVLV